MNYTNSVDYTPFQNNTDRNLIVLENNREKKLNYIDNPEKIVNQYSIDNEEHAIDNGEHAIDNEEHAIDNGEHAIDNGEHAIDNGEHSIDNGEHSIDNGEHSIDNREHAIDNGEHAIDNGEHAIDNGEHSIDNREQDRINKLHRESISNHIMTINKDLDVIYRFLEKPKNKSIEETNCCSKNCIIL